MGEKIELENENIDSTNIFDEFTDDENLKKEVEKIKIKRKKDFYYYLWKLNSFLKFLIIMCIIFFILLWWYFFIQNNKNFKSLPYFENFCFVFIGSMSDKISCGSVSNLLSDYHNKNSNLEKQIYFNNLGLVLDAYSISNFIFSKDVSFLVNKTENKIRPLQILEEFDKLKNEFEPINKTRLRCSNIRINKESILELNCSTYWWEWDNNIIWFDWKSWQNYIWWTSISRASSFINFLEKTENSNFILLDKPKQFSFTEIIDNYGYTRKTDFKLKLQFKKNNIWL